MLITHFVSVQKHLKCSTSEFPSESGALRVPFPTIVRMKRISGPTVPRLLSHRHCYYPQHPIHASPPWKHPAPTFCFHGTDGKQCFGKQWFGKQWFGKQWFFWVALVRDHSGRCWVISDDCQDCSCPLTQLTASSLAARPHKTCSTRWESLGWRKLHDYNFKKWAEKWSKTFEGKWWELQSDGLFPLVTRNKSHVVDKDHWA